MIDKEAENDAESEDLSDADVAAIEAMQRATPDQRANAGEDQTPPGDDEPVVEDKKPVAKDGDQGELPLDDDDDEPDEITLNAAGRAIDKDGKFVPKSAYLRVKEKAKTDRAEKDALALKVAKADERLNLLTEIINAQPDPADEKKPDAVKSPWDEADVDEAKDPLGAMAQARARNKYDREQHAKEIAELKATMEGDKKTNQANAQATAVYDAFKRDASAFHAKEPGFEAALGHMNGIWHAQLEVMGVADKDKREAMIAETQRNIITKSFQNQKSPSQAMFDLAVATGFKKPAAKDANGQEESDAAKKLNGLNKNMQANKSLSGAGGGALPDNAQAKRLIDMDDDEFADFANTLEGKTTLRKLGLM